MEIPKIITANWRILTVAGLMLLGIGWRLTPHIPNFAPIGAIALASGVLIGRRYAIVLPIGIMVISDLLLGFYKGIEWTWLAFALVTGLGLLIRKLPMRWRVPTGAVGASVVFFIVSNFGVWVASGMYPPTLAGLATCYTMAIPFFGPTLVSDMCFYVLFSLCTLFASNRYAKMTQVPSLILNKV